MRRARAPQTRTVDLSPSEYWTEDETPQTAIVRRSDNFVQALPAPRAQNMPPETLQEAFTVPSAAQTAVQLRTTYSDRARGFALSIAPVAAVTGVLAIVAGVVLWGVPVLSWVALQTFLLFFCVTWIVGYVLHTFVSPDGAAWLHVWQTWRMVRREQQFRHDRYWQAYHDGREDGRE